MSASSCPESDDDGGSDPDVRSRESGYFLLLLQAIVWDEYLTGPFGLIAQYSLLKVIYIYIRMHVIHRLVVWDLILLFFAVVNG